MSESFNEVIKRIREAAHADGPFVTYKVLSEVCGNTASGYASVQMFDRMCDMLQEAHDREHLTEHERMREFDRGYQAGKQAMDAERWAVSRRLRELDFSGHDGSHGNLSAIATAIREPLSGWTRGACEALRDELVRLLGGVHDEPSPTSAAYGDCDADCYFHSQQPQAVAYDELGNERHKAVCELRHIRDCLKGDSTINSLNISEAIGAKLDVGDHLHESICDRLIHLLGGDSIYEKPRNLTNCKCESESNSWESPKTINKEDDDGLADSVCASGDGMGDSVGYSELYKGAASIVAELRDCIETATKTYDDTPWFDMDGEKPEDHTICHIKESNLLRIADSIEEQFDRICQQHEAVLQSTIDRMADTCSELEAERDGLKKRVKDADSKGDTQKLHNLINVIEMDYGIRAQWDIARSTYHLYGTDPIDELEARLERAEHMRVLLQGERDELREQLNELDQSGATNLYKLLKHTMGEAKQIADSLRVSQHTRKSLMEDVLEKSKEAESLRVECRMYRTMLHDAVEEYKDATDARDTWFDQFEKAFTQEIEEIDDDVLSDRGLVRLPKDADGDYIHVGDVMEPVGDGESWTVKAIEYGKFVTLIKEGGGKAVAKYHRHHVEDPDTPDAIARDLLNGACTRNEAVSRMEKLHG